MNSIARSMFFVMLSACSGSFVESPEFMDVPAEDAGSISETKYNPCQIKTEKNTSNPRLIAKFCIDSDGKSSFQSFWDLKLEIDCTFEVASDLKTRCLPKNIQGSYYYSGYQCTQPIALVPFGSPAYVGVYKRTSDVEWISIYQATTPFKGPSFYMQYGGDCINVQIYFAGKKLYYVGQEVSSSEFSEQ